ncbi:MAG TPA: Gmad2 immunoglobulin-like domain-containing protein [Candidatus Moranbacteria bacterium]|nr:Gmad2 immunoglobulin-like domain-containing protein [Candidatus Moranbacteria bacterium]HRY28086.1 Gmad2 immunoglobulin-like domain-containing protein [Candidatus Moranbacteria bacterium]HSA08251.1 Gmad2 immunoglobulin-like domain-containing protein [Candidatus Moranbacteria bacterium]
MNKNKFKLIAVILLFVMVGCFFVLNKKVKIINPNRVNSFEACVDAGYPVQESFPRQCTTPSGKNFVEDIGNEFRKWDVIKIASPRPNQEIQSPLTIEGSAKGAWFFEAQFPIKLLDGNKKVIATSEAYAQGDWMTEDFVSFNAVIEFEKPKTKKGTLILGKDNPSGLAQNNDELIVPVSFADDPFEIFDIL